MGGLGEGETHEEVVTADSRVERDGGRRVDGIVCRSLGSVVGGCRWVLLPGFVESACERWGAVEVVLFLGIVETLPRTSGDSVRSYGVAVEQRLGQHGEWKSSRGFFPGYHEVLPQC